MKPIAPIEVTITTKDKKNPEFMFYKAVKAAELAVKRAVRKAGYSIKKMDIGISGGILDLKDDESPIYVYRYRVDFPKKVTDYTDFPYEKKDLEPITFTMKFDRAVAVY